MSRFRLQNRNRLRPFPRLQFQSFMFKMSCWLPPSSQHPSCLGSLFLRASEKVEIAHSMEFRNRLSCSPGTESFPTGGAALNDRIFLPNMILEGTMTSTVSAPEIYPNCRRLRDNHRTWCSYFHTISEALETHDVVEDPSSARKYLSATLTRGIRHPNEIATRLRLFFRCSTRLVMNYLGDISTDYIKHNAALDSRVIRLCALRCLYLGVLPLNKFS